MVEAATVVEMVDTHTAAVTYRCYATVRLGHANPRKRRRCV